MQRNESGGTIEEPAVDEGGPSREFWRLFCRAVVEGLRVGRMV